VLAGGYSIKEILIMKKFRTGVIGCGNIFPMHAYPANALENVEVVAICDKNETLAKQKASDFNCDYYTDFKEMIDKANLDVVHICTPHYLHPIMAIYAASKKVNILTEKPMAIKKEDAEDMIKAAKDNGVTLGVIFQNRYNPSSILIKDTLKSGKLGKIISAQVFVTWKRTDEYYSKSEWKGTWDKEGGGVVIDQSIHTMDLANWFIDDEIVSIDASIHTRAHDLIEVEDIAEGVVKYKNGVTLSFYTMNYFEYDAPVKIELSCENGIVKMEAEVATISLNDGTTLYAEQNKADVFEYGDNVKSYWGVSHVKQINNFYECLANDTQLDITAEMAMKTQNLICGIYDSGKTKQKITF
jgi:UDP-N-acetyl-2-amino-2-deoxyglucuronate dehydrogenase